MPCFAWSTRRPVSGELTAVPPRAADFHLITVCLSRFRFFRPFVGRFCSEALRPSDRSAHGASCGHHGLFLAVRRFLVFLNQRPRRFPVVSATLPREFLPFICGERAAASVIPFSESQRGGGWCACDCVCFWPIAQELLSGFCAESTAVLPRAVVQGLLELCSLFPFG